MAGPGDAVSNAVHEPGLTIRPGSFAAASAPFLAWAALMVLLALARAVWGDASDPVWVTIMSQGAVAMFVLALGVAVAGVIVCETRAVRRRARAPGGAGAES